MLTTILLIIEYLQDADPDYTIDAEYRVRRYIRIAHPSWPTNYKIELQQKRFGKLKVWGIVDDRYSLRIRIPPIEDPNFFTALEIAIQYGDKTHLSTPLRPVG